MSNKKTILKDLKKLKALNFKKRIKIRYKLLLDGSISLYLDHWKGSKREYQFLKIYLLNQVTSYNDDSNKLNLALSIRDKKQIELYQDENDFQLKNWKKEANFIEYFKSISETYPPTEKAWNTTYKYLNEFTKGFIKIKDIDETFCQNFKTYLTIEVSNNTAHTYFSKLKTSLNKAIKDRIISYNPTTGIRIKKTDTDRQFLIDSEIKKLINTKFDNHRNLKNAFLFSCFTGLRLSDIKVLKYEQIQSGYLKFRQVKTKGRERIKLSVNAINILEKQKELTGITGKVFDLPANVNITLRIWIEKAGIKKHITFHSARHTFATLCLTHDIDLYTVSKLLGHRSITATQIYAKLIDKKKDEAIDKLPIF